jgi:hypothetical protein
VRSRMSIPSVVFTSRRNVCKANIELDNTKKQSLLQILSKKRKVKRASNKLSQDQG